MSSLDEWLDVQDKLETIAFDASVHSHLAFWKIFADDLYPQ